MVAVLILDKVNLRGKKITTDIEEHYIMIKISLYQEVIIILNVDTPKNRASKIHGKKY